MIEKNEFKRELEMRKLIKIWNGHSPQEGGKPQFPLGDNRLGHHSIIHISQFSCLSNQNLHW
jgi:hypothetical protein